MLNDIRYAIRTLSKSPGFALTAILSIALGIGPNTAIFSLQDGLLLRPLAIEKPSEVVTITSRPQNGTIESFTYRDFVELREKNRSFEGLVGVPAHRNRPAPPSPPRFNLVTRRLEYVPQG